MLMAVLMIASLVPATALAADTSADDEYVINQKADAEKKLPGITVKEVKTGDVVTGYDVTIKAFAKVKDQCKTCTDLVTKVLIAPTCELPGLTVYYCGTCGKPMMDALDSKLVAEALGHSYAFTVVEKPTCTESGWGYAVCSVCGKAVAVMNSADAFALLSADEKKDEETVKATKALFDKTGHADGVAVAEDVYEEDGETLHAKAEVKPGHSVTIKGYAVCYKDGKIVDASVKGAKVADTSGYSGDKVCPVCNVKTTTGHNVDSLDTDHSAYVKVIKAGEKPYIDSDKDKIDGATDYVYCAKCNAFFGGDVLTYDEFFQPADSSTPAIGTTKIATEEMNLGNGVTAHPAVAATCQKEGYTGDTVTYSQTGINEDGEAVGTWVLTKTGKKLEKLEHHFVKFENKAATCTKDGVAAEGWYVCDNVVGKDNDGKDIKCNAPNHDFIYKEPTTVPKTNHDFTVEKVLVEATCQNSGLSVRVCSVCGAYETKNDVVKVEATPAVKCVAAEELANVVEATCTEKGYTGDKVCKWCGTVLEKGEETELAEHNYVNGVCTVCEAVDPDYVENPFTDVSKDSVFYDAIIWAVQNKVTNGTTDTTFSPNKGCTRAEIVAFLYNAAGCPEVGADVENPFTDVSKDSNFYNAIMWAVEKGITKGTTDTTFSPSKVCTRGEIVTFLFRASGDEKVSTGVAFTDVAEGSYCYDAVAWAVANKVAFGKTGTTFAPADTCTRAEAVTFIYRASAE